MKKKVTGIRPVLVIAGLALALGSLAGCPARWTPCECDETQYTLSMVNFPGGYGTTSKSPDKTNYKKGDYVALTFTPNESGRFVMWTCTPPSHLASGSKDTSVGVYITDDSAFYLETVAAAWSGPKAQTLYVDWDRNRGYVEIPTNGQGGSGTLTASVNYGETITLTAVPSPGYYTVWHGQWYNNFWSGERYGNTVTVKMLGSTRLVASFRHNSEYPETMKYVSVNASGGADVFCSGATTASFSSGTYPATNAYGPSQFSFSVHPQKGYAFNYMTWVADNQRWFSTNSAFGYYPPGSYSAYLSKTVKLDIETEGQGVVTSPDFLSEWNPKPYSPLGQGNSLTPQPNWNQVTMKADPCKGWIFDHWEYKDAQNNAKYNTDNSINVYMNWWPGNYIRVPDGTTTFKVKAIFKEVSCLVVEGGDISYDTKAYDTLLEWGYDVERLRQPPESALYTEIYKRDVFCFNGHGGENSINMNGKNSINAIVGPSTITNINKYPGSQVAHPYLLVYLNSCNSAAIFDGNAWKLAFNASCLIGWKTTVTDWDSYWFDKYFWQYFRYGYDAREAVERAHSAASYFYNPLGSREPVCNGNIILPNCEIPPIVWK